MIDNFEPIYENTEHVADYDLTHSKHVLEMLTIGIEYVRFMDEIGKYDKRTIMQYLQKILPLIYLKASLIPEITIEDNSADERFVTEEEYETLLQILKEKFEAPCNEEHTCDCTDEGVKVAEALTDLYQDLKDTNLLFGTNKLAAQECAINNCRLWFIERWGLAVADLLGYFHTCLYHLHKHDSDNENQN